MFSLLLGCHPSWISIDRARKYMYVHTFTCVYKHTIYVPLHTYIIICLRKPWFILLSSFQSNTDGFFLAFLLAHLWISSLTVRNWAPNISKIFIYLFICSATILAPSQGGNKKEQKTKGKGKKNGMKRNFPFYLKIILSSDSLSQT